MHTEKIVVDRAEAAVLFRKYKEHAAYSDPIDWEIQRTYDLIARGKVIIRALESIKQAGLNRGFLPSWRSHRQPPSTAISRAGAPDR